MRITTVEDTDLFLGPEAAPRQVVRVTLTATTDTGPLRVRVEGPTVRTPEETVTTPLAAGEQRVVEVGVHVAAPASEGSVHRITVIAESGDARVTAKAAMRVAATGWTMWMISHFHYDPVWWNTQRGFTEVWQQLPDVPKADKLRPAFVRTAFDLVRAHLDAARADDDYRFVLAEIDYLKPYWDVYPEDRKDLRRMLHEGRVELVGGMYNEPNTNLTHPESTIRNTVHGVAYQREVLGGDPQTAWMLDVFGHDPAFPGLMADAGLTSSSWARGPFHHIGARRHTGDIERMQFPSEFEWVSPTGRGVLTAYMANHYVAGWDVERKNTLEEAMAEAYAQYRELRKVSATRNVMLPVGHDHNIPSRWCTEIHREWPYVWPKFRMGIPRDFFDAVRAEQPRFSPQTRDMNPVYTGKDVSYIDTKQAQRAGETVVLDAERFGTLAALLGGRYPAEELDKAWRLLAYGAHHDAVTGTESDQVYLDLVAGWREAWELGATARSAALRALGSFADTRGRGQAVLVANPLSWSRDGVTTVRADFPAPGPRGVTVLDDRGNTLPAVAEGETRHPDGTLASVTLSVAAQEVPALGYQVWRVVPAASVPVWTAGDSEAPDPSIENEAFRITCSGGALTSIHDLRHGRELLRADGAGGELVVQQEYPDHPFWGEGPWHLLPRGPGVAVTGTSARVEHSPAGSRLVIRGTFEDLTVTREVLLWHGVDRVDFRTHVDGSIGADRLLRVRFDFDGPGALPVSDVGFAAIGRSFGFPNVDAAESLWTLDNPAHTWAGLSATARIRVAGTDVAIGVAEIISEHDQRDLMTALVAQGVTATGTRPAGERYGSLDADSNLPDVRIVVGENAFTDQVLASAEPGCRETLTTTGRVYIPAIASLAEAWVPDADLRGPRDLPVLIVTDTGRDALIADLADAVIEIPDVIPGVSGFSGYSMAVVNHGTPGFVVEPDGTFHMSLMRACTGWPSGVWIDGPQRTTPDGTGFALQHWSHTFRYSLVAGAGDWRQAGFVHAGQEVNHPLVAEPVPSSAGTLPVRASLGSVEPASAVLTALKPRGNPLAAGLPGTQDVGEGLTVRIYESTGTPQTARIRIHGGLRDATRTDVLEAGAADGRLEAADGEVIVDLAAADVVTVSARPVRAATVVDEPAVEPVQPVPTRYWMHNKGPAPLGNLPVAVHLSPTAATLPATLRLTVGSATAATAGTVELIVPPGLEVTADGTLDYDLAAGEHHTIDLHVTGDGDGVRHLAARIVDPFGQRLEDTAALAVGDPTVAPVEATLEPAVLSLAPGGTGRLTLTLRNPAAGPVRGDAQLVSPYGTWSGEATITPWIRGWELPAGGTRTLTFDVVLSGDARPGADYWALVRVVGMGEVGYTPGVHLRVVDLEDLPGHAGSTSP
ncbi:MULTISPECIES: glycoside hydrolase family 38 C-terminal domain-containing protein [Actinoplanes]|uniref:glycoside hydrolase family 38 N-terminal domain-containing protein n=1 Tax=Actinoplanes TaxID=1865 RepID=UPI0005F2B514|nr:MULTISPECIES: glycoside hydrolase family 38 C-terminal domain-containing protein [Actinoplanes]GLY04553.1 alpha-mannosidase [Actinoplanes sp. NBRC 101535]